MERAMRIEAELDKFDQDNAPDLVVYAEGLVCASVCSRLSKEETVQRMEHRFSGTRHGGWVLADKEHFATGQPQGVACDQKPTTHRHWLFNC